MFITDFYPYMKNLGLVLPPILLILSDIFAFAVLAKVFKQLNYQFRHNRASMSSTIRIASVIGVQCVMMSFLLFTYFFKSYELFVPFNGGFRANRVLFFEDPPSWFSYLMDEGTIQSLNVIRVFLDSFIVLIVLSEYRKNFISFLKVFITLFVNPKVAVKKIKAKIFNQRHVAFVLNSSNITMIHSSVISNDRRRW